MNCYSILLHSPTHDLSFYNAVGHQTSSTLNQVVCVCVYLVPFYFLLCSVISLHLWLFFSFTFFVFPLFPWRWLSLILSVYHFPFIPFIDLWECATYLFCAHLVPFAWVPLPTTFFFFDIINSENLSDPIFLLRQLIIISSPFAFLMYSFSTFSVYILFLIVLYLYIFCPQRDEAIFYLISKVYLFSKKF